MAFVYSLWSGQVKKSLIYYLLGRYSGGDSKTEPTERAWQSISGRQLNILGFSGKPFKVLKRSTFATSGRVLTKLLKKNSDQRRKGGRPREAMQSGQNASMDKQSPMQSNESLESLKGWQRNLDRHLIDYGEPIWSPRALHLKVWSQTRIAMNYTFSSNLETKLQMNWLHPM